MNRIRHLGLAAGIVAVGCLLGACGSNGSSATSTSSGSSSENGTPSTTSAAQGGATGTTSAPTGGTGSSAGGSASAAITSVVFTGTTQDPTVTVNGTGLGSMPAANPTSTPEGQQLCPLPPSGNQGYDYGTSLYLFDSSRNWAGGRYRPSLNELDCVGLLVSKFTPTQVVFKFGSAYAQYQQKDNYLLAEGDAYEIAVNGATLTGTVHYT